ncbi:hypothetical protein ACFUG9_23690 [Streptomyces griseoincarnatus]
MVVQGHHAGERSMVVSDPVDGAGSLADGFRIVLGTTEDIQAFHNLFGSDLSTFGLLATLLDAESLTVMSACTRPAR